MRGRTWFTPLIAAIVTGAVLSPAPSAHAADPRFCRSYAKGAVKQAHLAVSSADCQAKADQSRWSTDDRVHYEWCRGVSLAEAERERAARTTHLRECRRAAPR